jgi:hypothetical protein
MRYGLSLLVALAWALWLGGLMTLFITVSRLFAVNRPTAVVAAPQMFITFEAYQLGLAMVALLASAIWRVREPRASLTTLFALFALTSIVAIIQSTFISPKMHRLREMGQSSGPEFMQLHGKSMMHYTMEAALLLIAGLVFIAALSSRTTASTEPASAPPAGPADRGPST